MSSFDSKKTKRRKSKKSPVVKTPSSQATCQNFSSSADTSDLRQKEILTPAIDTEVILEWGSVYKLDFGEKVAI